MHHKQNGGAMIMALMLAVALAILASALVYIVRINALQNHAVDRVIEVRSDLQLSLNHWLENSVNEAGVLDLSTYQQDYTHETVTGEVTGQSSMALSAKLFSAQSLMQIGLSMVSKRGDITLENLLAYYSYPHTAPADLDGRYYLNIPYMDQKNLHALQDNEMGTYQKNQSLGYFQINSNQLTYRNQGANYTSSLPIVLTSPKVNIGWKLDAGQWSFQIMLYDTNHWITSEPILLNQWLSSDVPMSLISWSNHSASLDGKTVVNGAWYPHGQALLPMMILSDSNANISVKLFDGEHISTQDLTNQYSAVECLGIDAKSNLDTEQALVIAKRTDNNTIELYQSDYISGENGLSLNEITPTISCNLNTHQQAPLDVIGYAPNQYYLLMGCQNQFKVFHYDAVAKSVSEVASKSLSGNIKLLQAYGAFTLIVTVDNHGYLLSSVSGEILAHVNTNSHANAQLLYSPSGLWIQSGDANCLENSSVQNCRSLPMALVNFGVIGLVMQ